MNENSENQILVTGSTIGRALAEQFASDENINEVFLTWRSTEPAIQHDKITPVQLDLTVDADVKTLLADLPPLSGIVNTVGLLHDGEMKPEKAISRFNAESLLTSIEANVLPTMLLAKHAKRSLKNSPNSWFAALSAKVGSIEDNRLGGWYSYRASKAALNMALKTLSVEWKFALPNCAVAALHPGTVTSPLSAPFTKGDSQRTVFTPEQSAEYLKTILDGLTPDQTGRFWSWDGTELPW